MVWAEGVKGAGQLSINGEEESEFSDDPQILPITLTT